MDASVIYRIVKLSDYPADAQLTSKELESIMQQCEEGLATINGDTAPVHLTVRQISLLLRAKVAPTLSASIST